jgi:hypothetical protein
VTPDVYKLQMWPRWALNKPTTCGLDTTTTVQGEVGPRPVVVCQILIYEYNCRKFKCINWIQKSNIIAKPLYNSSFLCCEIFGDNNICVFQYSRTNKMHFLFSVHYELTASTCFKHYVLIIRRHYT